jgi:hypothetical protein
MSQRLRNAATDPFWQTNRWDTDYETPPDAWDALFLNLRLPKGRRLRVWDPFYCQGLSQQLLEERGCQVIHNPQDFFTWAPNARSYDVILTNPPYSQKKKVFERMLQVGKPFAMILPVSTLAANYFAQLLPGQSIPFQVIIPSRRVTFIKNGQPTKMSPFDSMWLCVRMQDYLLEPSATMVFNVLKEEKKNK